MPRYRLNKFHDVFINRRLFQALKRTNFEDRPVFFMPTYLLKDQGDSSAGEWDDLLAYSPCPAILIYLPSQGEDIKDLHPGQFFEVWKTPHRIGFFVYALMDCARKTYRELVFCSDLRYSLSDNFGTGETELKEPWLPYTRFIGGEPFSPTAQASGSLLSRPGVQNNTSFMSFQIKREQSTVRETKFFLTCAIIYFSEDARS